MKTQTMYLLALSLVFVLSGCVVRTYKLTKDRLDQELTAGNRGYLKGELPAGEEAKAKTRKATRTIQAVEIELHSPIKFEKIPKAKGKTEGISGEKVSAGKTEYPSPLGNRGYISRSPVSETAAPAPKMEKYTVKKGDTLQKISKEMYGTTKEWVKIYEANKDVLKAPDKIYPGQVINIPE